MAGLPKFEEKLNNMVDSAVQRSNPVLKGLILRSYYTEDTAEVLLDVSIIGGNGGAMDQLTGVPLMRTWGMQQTLPPLGATAVMLTDGDRRNGTFAIAVFETKVTRGRTSDDKAPDPLPKVLLS